MTTAARQALDRRRANSGIGLRLLALLLRLIGVCALLVTSLALIRSEPWQPVARRPATAAANIPYTGVNPLGVNTFLASEVETWKREKTLDMVAAAGIGWIAQHFAWAEIEPEDNVYWDVKYDQDAWRKFDEIVTLAEQRGIRVIAKLDQTPAWARPPGSDPSTPPSDLNAFGDFVEVFVRHYQGRVRFLQIWNEPNLASSWGGRIDPAGYAALLRVAAERARAADPNVVILSAPMAMTTENSARAWDELRYWQALYDNGVADSFDIMGANAYGLDRPPDDPPDPSRINFRRLELQREVQVRNGDADKPIWLNEYGWNAAPASFPPEQLTWSRVSDDQQADWTVEGIRYAREHWSWFGVANIWYFRHVGDIPPTRAEYYFRMVDVEFAPRAVYLTVRDVGHGERVAKVGTYGDLEAPVVALGNWQVVRDAGSIGGSFLRGDSGATLMIRFSGSHLDLKLRPGLSRGQVTVRVVDGEAPAASVAGGEHLLVSEQTDVLRIEDADSGVTLPSGQRARTALIELGPDTALAIDGIEVRYTRPLPWLAVVVAIAVVAFTGAAALGRAGRRRLQMDAA